MHKIYFLEIFFQGLGDLAMIVISKTIKSNLILITGLVSDIHSQFLSLSNDHRLIIDEMVLWFH